MGLLSVESGLGGGNCQECGAVNCLTRRLLVGKPSSSTDCAGWEDGGGEDLICGLSLHE